VIFKGRMRAEGEPGTGAMVWHPVLHFPGATVETLLVSGIAASPRLYIGLARGYTGSVAYITLPRNAEANPLYDELVTLGTEGHFYFSAIDFGSPGSLKVVSRVDIVAENLSEDDYLDVLMRVDGGTWRGLGRVTANGGQALTESALAGEEFEIQIQSVANAAVPAPSAGRLKKVIIEGTERPPVVDIHSLTVRASDGLIDGYGTQVQANRRTIIGTLRALARANTPVYFQDPDGELHYGLVLPGITYSELHQQDDRPVEFLIGFRFQTLRTFGTVGRYGSATYGRDVYGARQIRTTTYGTGVYGDADYGGG